MAKINDDEANIHAGHRQRLLNQICKAGIENMSDIVAMEFILTYVFPRCDTNKIAHRLLDQFGSPADVLNADWHLTKDIKGMGETSAKKLHALVDIFDYYTTSSLDKKYEFIYRTDIADFFEELLRFRNVETSYIVGLDASSRIKGKAKLSVGGVKSVGIDMHAILNFITNAKPAIVMLAHNHPQGKAQPSKADVDGTNLVLDMLKPLGIPLLDHIIVGIDGVFGMKNNEFYRTFENC